MRRTAACSRLLSLCTMMIPMLAGGCSGGRTSAARGGPRLDSVFDGFHLGDAKLVALEEANRRGLSLACVEDESFQPFCAQGETVPAGRPAMALGFRDGRLVSLARSISRERGYAGHVDWSAQYRREFGAPLLDGWMNPFMHATMWASGDSTVLGTLTCARPADPSSCEMGVDRMPRAHVRQMIGEWRDRVARTNQSTAGTLPVEEYVRREMESRHLASP